MGEAQPAAGQTPVTAEVTARRFRVASPRTVLVLGALIIVLVALDALLGHAAHGGGAGLWFVALLIAALGLVVARRQPANPLGWLLMGFSVWVALYDSAGAYAVWDYRFHHRRVRGPAAGRGGPGRGPRRPGRCCAPGPGTRPRIGVDQPARLRLAFADSAWLAKHCVTLSFRCN